MMEGKFIIFVLVASFAQSSFAQRLNVTYGLTENELVGLNGIIVKMDVALKAMSASFNLLFDLIQKLASSLIYDRQVGAGPSIISIVRKARLLAITGWDQCPDAIEIALGIQCSAVEESREATNAKLVSAYYAITSGILLSATGQTSAALRAVVRSYLTTSKEPAYNSIRICASIEDANQLATILQVEDKARLALKHLTNALFNAMDVYAAAVSAGRADVSLIYTIEGSRQQALDAISVIVGNGYSALRAFYIFSRLEQTEIFFGLTSNQFAQTVATYKFEAMIEVIFKTILTHLDQVSLGLKDAGRPTFTSDDVEEAIAVANDIAGTNAILDYIYTVHSNDASALSAAKEQLVSFARGVISLVYDAIAVAQNAGTADNSDWQSKIKVLRKETLAYFAPAADGFFNAFRNGKTWDKKTEIQFRTLQDAALESILAAPRSIFDAIMVLAKAVVADSATPCDFSEVLNDKAESNIALNFFIQYISAAGVVVLTANP